MVRTADRPEGPSGDGRAASGLREAVRSAAPTQAETGETWVQEAEFDSAEEVDAVARSLRRIALEYAGAMLVALLVVPVLSLTASWWFARPVVGGLTLNFLFVALGLHIVFLIAALAYNHVATRSEDEMLGRLDQDDDAR